MRGDSPPSRGNLPRLVLLAVLVVPFSLLLGVLGVPAAWLVGPMFVAVALALSAPGLRPLVPPRTRVVAQAAIGVVLASGFEPQTLPLIARYWFSVLIVVVGTMLFSLASGLLLARFTHLDRRTALVGVLPGAASGMLAMSESVGADPRVVAVMQYGRVVLIVLCATIIAGLTGQVSGGSTETAAPTPDALIQSLPFVYLISAVIAAVGVWLGAKSRLPAGALLGPLILGVLAEEFRLVSLEIPPGSPQAAFATIGAYAGLLFDRDSVLRVARLLPWLLLSNVVLMFACAALGLVLTLTVGTDILTAYLATTPGGIDSVAVLAIESDSNLSLVTAIQTLRIFAVIACGAAIGKLLSKNT